MGETLKKYPSRGDEKAVKKARGQMGRIAGAFDNIDSTLKYGKRPFLGLLVGAVLPRW